MKQFLVLFVFAVFIVQVLGGVSLLKRSLRSNASANTSAEESIEKKEICQGRTPCGWAVYNRVNRFIDYFMKNKCECSDDKKCLRDDDDISITAYVYRCKTDEHPKTTTPTS